MMINALRNKTLAVLERAHRDEGGAVAMLSMAAIMILFMIGLVIYDAGEATRDKIDAQMAADTGAFSEAAVRARSMNTIAFANIGKRTVVGIHNMYSGQWPAYMAWLSGQCKKCCCGKPFWCGCWTACLNCSGNWASLVPIFSGIKFFKYALSLITGKSKLHTNLKDLDAYQKSLKDYSAFWAVGEGVTRSLRNGADTVGTYPHPNTTQYTTKLPLDTGSKAESCLVPIIVNPLTLGTMAEWRSNFAEQKRLSASKPLWALKGPKEVTTFGKSLGISYAGCLVFALVGPGEMKPWYNDAAYKKGDNAVEKSRNMMRMSNLTFSYRYNPDMANKLNDNYNFMAKQTVDRRNAFYFGYKSQGGTWSMARGEFVFPENNRPFVLLKGSNDIWMFHPGWISKLRPVTLPNEVMPVKFEDMFKANRSTSNGGARLFYRAGAKGLNFITLTNFMDLLWDVQFNGVKAFRALDSESKHGSDSKYLYDGLHK